MVDRREVAVVVEKAVEEALAIEVITNDLPRIVDVARQGASAERIVDRREHAAAVKKAMGNAVGVLIVADDLASLGDPERLGSDPGRARKIDRNEGVRHQLAPWICRAFA